MTKVTSYKSRLGHPGQPALLFREQRDPESWKRTAEGSTEVHWKQVV